MVSSVPNNRHSEEIIGLFWQARFMGKTHWFISIKANGNKTKVKRFLPVQQDISNLSYKQFFFFRSSPTKLPCRHHRIFLFVTKPHSSIGCNKWQLLQASLRVSRKDTRIPMILKKEIQRKETCGPKAEVITINKSSTGMGARETDSSGSGGGQVVGWCEYGN